MHIKSIREKKEMLGVLMAPEAAGTGGPDIAYWIFTDISSDQAHNTKWKNMTVLASGKYGNEFNKTYGHYHKVKVSETSRLIHGKGVLLLQNAQNEAIVIFARPGDEFTITPGFAHSWSNAGSEPLIAYDNWSAPDDSHDYKTIEKHKGMCLYLIEENNEVKPVPNPTYGKLPEPRVLTAESFKNYIKSLG